MAAKKALSSKKATSSKKTEKKGRTPVKSLPKAGTKRKSKSKK